MLSYFSLLLTSAWPRLGLLFNGKDNKCQVWQVVKLGHLKTARIQLYSCDHQMLNIHLFESFVQKITFSFSLLYHMKWFAFFQFIWHMCTELYPLPRKWNCQKLPITPEPLKTCILRINKIWPCEITGLWIIEWKSNHFMYAASSERNLKSPS